MELQFNKKEIACMQQIISQQREQELSQEIRLPDGFPDIGSVIGSWGQLIIRGKEWRDDSVGVSGGVNVWFLYRTEPGDEYKVVESWIPFSTKYNMDMPGKDGTIITLGHINFVDTRSTSPRKVFLRTGITVSIRAFISGNFKITEAKDVPEHLQIKTTPCNFRIPSETGEKLYALEEPLPLPEDLPCVNKVLFYDLHSEIAEMKVIGSRLVFRGIAHLRLVYMSDDEKVYSYVFDIPFSQHTELDHTYEEGADASVYPIVTNLEIEQAEGGMTRMKADITGQYIIYNCETLEVIDDAYSTQYDCEIHAEKINIYTSDNESSIKIEAKQNADINADRVVACSFSVYEPTDSYVHGRFYVLYYDKMGQLQSAYLKWESDPVSLEKPIVIDVSHVRGLSQDPLSMSANVIFENKGSSTNSMDMICSVNLIDTERTKVKPTVVLLRNNNDDLWDIAKQCSSTVDEIRKANRSSDDLNGIILVPVI